MWAPGCPRRRSKGSAGSGQVSDLARLAIRARHLLMGAGLNEAVSHTLLPNAWLRRTRCERSPVWRADDAVAIVLRNPISEEADTLRPSLLPGLLAAVVRNRRFGIEDVWLHECGWAHAFAGRHGAPEDRFLVAGLLLGSRWSETWNPPRERADFFAGKGVVEQLARELGAGPLLFERATIPAFHPGRSAVGRFGDRVMAAVGELHPEVAADLDLPPGVILFEFDAQACLARCQPVPRYRPPSRFPAVERDLAVVVSRDTPAAAVEATLREALAAWGRSVRLFDLYTGAGVPEGWVSLAYRIEIGAEDRTLTDAEADARLEAARAALRERFDARFRG